MRRVRQQRLTCGSCAVLSAILLSSHFGCLLGGHRGGFVLLVLVSEGKAALAERALCALRMLCCDSLVPRSHRGHQLVSAQRLDAAVCVLRCSVVRWVGRVVLVLVWVLVRMAVVKHGGGGSDRGGTGRSGDHIKIIIWGRMRASPVNMHTHSLLWRPCHPRNAIWGPFFKPMLGQGHGTSKATACRVLNKLLFLLLLLLQ